MTEKIMYDNYPDTNGYFGNFGGRFIPEILIPAIQELNTAFENYTNTNQFKEEFSQELTHYVGRPSPLYFAKRWSEKLGGAKIFLKREDLNHTGAHKINHAIGQILLARFMKKKRIIAETGAGQHGVATATVAARFGLQCVIYMGQHDIERQAANVYRMKLLGAEVVPVTSGSKTLKDAVNQALRDWVSNIDDTFYLLGTVVGPHPYPKMVRTFQSIIGQEAKKQCLQLTGHLPDALIACVGGGSNAMGLFYPFLNDENVKMFGIEAGGKGVNTEKHACRLSHPKGTVGILHGNRTHIMTNDAGYILESYSISAGLDYPGVGPEHAWLQQCERITYDNATDEEALKAFHDLTRLEGIIPALESSHALAYAEKLAPQMKDKVIIVNLSGRGDKDIATVAQLDGIQLT